MGSFSRVFALTTPTTEPTQFVAGDTAKWLKTLAEYPASAGWALAYTLINSANKITFGSTAQGTDFLVNVSATTTATWAAGTYAWRAQVSKSGEVFTVGQGSLVIKAAFSAATLETRSTSAIMLDNVNAALTKTASENVLEYEIAGRRLKHYSMGELLQLRDRLTADVARETAAANIANGLGNPGRIYVRF